MNPLPRVKHFSVKSELNKAIRIDSGLSGLVENLGYPAARRTDADFSTLAKIINSQQLSTHAATAIWGRLENHCHGLVTPQKILHRNSTQLGECGLSKRKIDDIRDLAKMVSCGELVRARRGVRSDDEGIAELVKIRGMGVW